MTFFFDNCVPIGLAKILQIAEFDVIHFQEIWPDAQHPEGVADETWIPEIGNRGYIVVSGDLGITTKPAQVIALKKAGLVFYGIYGGFTGQRINDQARWLFKNWEHIEGHARKQGAKGHAYEVRSDSQIRERNLREVKKSNK